MQELNPWEVNDATPTQAALQPWEVNDASPTDHPLAQRIPRIKVTDSSGELGFGAKLERMENNLEYANRVLTPENGYSPSKNMDAHNDLRAGLASMWEGDSQDVRNNYAKSMGFELFKDPKTGFEVTRELATGNVWPLNPPGADWGDVRSAVPGAISFAKETAAGLTGGLAAGGIAAASGPAASSAPVAAFIGAEAGIALAAYQDTMSRMEKSNEHGANYTEEQMGDAAVSAALTSAAMGVGAAGVMKLFKVFGKGSSKKLARIIDGGLSKADASAAAKLMKESEKEGFPLDFFDAVQILERRGDITLDRTLKEEMSEIQGGFVSQGLSDVANEQDRILKNQAKELQSNLRDMHSELMAAREVREGTQDLVSEEKTRAALKAKENTLARIEDLVRQDSLDRVDLYKTGGNFRDHINNGYGVVKSGLSDHHQALDDALGQVDILVPEIGVSAQRIQSLMDNNLIKSLDDQARGLVSEAASIGKRSKTITEYVQKSPELRSSPVSRDVVEDVPVNGRDITITISRLKEVRDSLKTKDGNRDKGDLNTVNRILEALEGARFKAARKAGYTADQLDALDREWATLMSFRRDSIINDVMEVSLAGRQAIADSNIVDTVLSNPANIDFLIENAWRYKDQGLNIEDTLSDMLKIKYERDVIEGKMRHSDFMKSEYGKAAEHISPKLTRLLKDSNRIRGEIAKEERILENINNDLEGYFGKSFDFLDAKGSADFMRKIWSSPDNTKKFKSFIITRNDKLWSKFVEVQKRELLDLDKGIEPKQIMNRLNNLGDYEQLEMVFGKKYLNNLRKFTERMIDVDHKFNKSGELKSNDFPAPGLGKIAYRYIFAPLSARGRSATAAIEAMGVNRKKAIAAVMADADAIERMSKLLEDKSLSLGERAWKRSISTVFQSVGAYQVAQQIMDSDDGE